MGCNMDFSNWRREILYEIENLVFHNFNVFFGGKNNFPEYLFFRSDQCSLLIYICLHPSSATVKMDNGENMENVLYATDDTAGFINQMKNRNTIRKTEYDLKLINHKSNPLIHNITLLHHISYLVSENDHLSQTLRKTH